MSEVADPGTSPAFEGMQLRGLVEEERLRYLVVEVTAGGATIPCRFKVDSRTAAELQQVLAFRPFAANGPSTTYWHQGSFLDPSGDTKYRLRVVQGDLSQSLYVPCTARFLRDIRWLQEIKGPEDLESLRIA